MIQDVLGRVKRLLLSPADEWDAIAGEPADMGDTYKNYVLPLVAFAALCVASGFLWAGLMALALRVFIACAISWLVGVYIYALVIDALAPSFGGQKNFGQALKVAAYSPTAFWVVSIFAVIPPLRILTVFGLYSLYLLYLGIPKLMKAPEDKAILYTASAIVCGVVAMIIVNVLLSITGFGLHMF